MFPDRLLLLMAAAMRRRLHFPRSASGNKVTVLSHLVRNDCGAQLKKQTANKMPATHRQCCRGAEVKTDTLALNNGFVATSVSNFTTNLLIKLIKKNIFYLNRVTVFRLEATSLATVQRATVTPFSFNNMSNTFCKFPPLSALLFVINTKLTIRRAAFGTIHGTTSLA